MNHSSLKSEETPCNCDYKESIPFLDTLCHIKEGKIVTDLYKKPTDRNQYLLTDSCHPAEVTNNIPLSLAMRIVRICTEPEKTRPAATGNERTTDGPVLQPGDSTPPANRQTRDLFLWSRSTPASHLSENH